MQIGVSMTTETNAPQLKCWEQCVAALLIVLLSVGMQAQSDGVITVRHVRTTSDSIRIRAEINRQPVDMFCQLDQPKCNTLRPDVYVFTRMPSRESRYTDCVNVRLYKRTNHVKPGKSIGEYCILPTPYFGHLEKRGQTESLSDEEIRGNTKYGKYGGNTGTDGTFPNSWKYGNTGTDGTFPNS